MKDQIDIILKDIHKLPPMSNVVIKVMTLIQDPAVSIHDLATEISKDPAITASIINLPMTPLATTATMLQKLTDTSPPNLKAV